MTGHCCSCAIWNVVLLHWWKVLLQLVYPIISRDLKGQQSDQLLYKLLYCICFLEGSSERSCRNKAHLPSDSMSSISRISEASVRRWSRSRGDRALRLLFSPNPNTGLLRTISRYISGEKLRIALTSQFMWPHPRWWCSDPFAHN